MVTEFCKSHSVCSEIISELRDVNIQDNRSLFRENLRRLGWITAYEISKSLNYEQKYIQTPLEKSKAHKISDQVVLLPILRAGIPFFNGFEDVFRHAEIGFIGSWREEGKDHEHPESKVGYVTSPNLDGKTVLLIDTMLATGNSFLRTIDHLGRFGQPNVLHVASVIASRQGVDTVKARLEEEKTNYKIWVTAIDPELNKDAYIVPGLGDAGDLSYGPKLT